MRKALLLAVLVWMVKPALGQSPDESPQVLVRIQPQRTEVRLGEAVEVWVEIENVGQTPVFVGRRFSGGREFNTPYYLQILLEDSKGRELHPRELTIADCFGGARNRAIESADEFRRFFNLLFKHWVLLGPGYSYGTTLTVEPQSFEGVKTGRYKIRAQYLCRGITSSAMCNPFDSYVDLEKHLPAPAFEGKATSDRAEIRIVAGKPAKR